MNENVKSQLDAELAYAGEETVLSPQMLLLEQLRITPEKELEPMEFLFRLFGKPCFPRRELVAITGKAKSGKTFDAMRGETELGHFDLQQRVMELSNVRSYQFLARLFRQAIEQDVIIKSRNQQGLVVYQAPPF